MCECLLEAYEKEDGEKVGTADLQVCKVQVRTTYELGLDPIDPQGFVPRTVARTEVCTVVEEL